LWIN